MKELKTNFRIWVNKVLIMFIWLVMLVYLSGLSIIPVSSIYILYAISCVVVVYTGCWLLHLLDEANKRLRKKI